MGPKGHSFRPLLAAALLSLAIMGCSSPQSRARTAYVHYQTAIASDDTVAARRALLDLVAAQDDVADNWVELGRLDTRLGRYADAYYAFTRAHELDRGNPEIVRILTQLALQVGDLSEAQRHARELDVVAPGDPWVKLVSGYSALSQHRFDEALSASDALLTTNSFDSNAIVLKARSLIGAQREQDALKLLEDHVRLQPTDAASWKLLARIFEWSSDWQKVASAGYHLVRIDPSDREAAVLFIKASLRSGDLAAAKQESSHILTPAADPVLIAKVLDLWADYWPSDQKSDEARRLARSANRAQKLVYAAFLNRTDRASDALALAAPFADLPVRADSVEANAVVGDAMARTGKVNDAKSRLDAVLAFDPGNATALRSRAELLIKMGQAKLAIADAQKLVTVLPQSPRDRMLLAQCFAVSGDSRQAERALWDAFHEIEASEPIFLALSHANSAQPEVVSQIKEEYALQRDAALNRGYL